MKQQIKKKFGIRLKHLLSTGLKQSLILNLQVHTMNALVSALILPANTTLMSVLP